MILAGPEERDHGCPEYKVRHIVDVVKDKWGNGVSASLQLALMVALGDGGRQ